MGASRSSISNQSEINDDDRLAPASSSGGDLSTSPWRNSHEDQWSGYGQSRSALGANRSWGSDRNYSYNENDGRYRQTKQRKSGYNPPKARDPWDWRKGETCKYWLENRCTRGTNCPYMHPYSR